MNRICLHSISPKDAWWTSWFSPEIWVMGRTVYRSIKLRVVFSKKKFPPNRLPDNNFGCVIGQGYMSHVAFPKSLSESLCKMASSIVAYSVFLYCINELSLYRRPGFLPGNKYKSFVGNGIPTFNLFHSDINLFWLSRILGSSFIMLRSSKVI